MIANSFKNFRIARSIVTTFKEGGFRWKTGFSDLAHFAINRWNVQRTTASC
jgi:hypothetical protein